MRIETERLTIRPVMASDWPAIQAIWKDFQASPYAQYDRPSDTADASVQARIRNWAKANEGTEHVFLAVCLQGAVIGYAAFNVRKDGYETGYCFHSAYHGKGYAQESLRAMLECLRERGITKLIAGTARANTPSVALLKALGFQLKWTEQVSFYKDADGKDIVFEGGIFELNME